MKNLKRILLLIAITVIAQKILFSDFHFSKEKGDSSVVVSTSSF
ncbi:MAG: hypothetical protein R2802_09280 [Flavobacteriaceae bacterium]|nr:hypothetical protein [Mangrovimonas sp.]HRV54640.1 hypothetical protein [Mangrovimonas sp.]